MTRQFRVTAYVNVEQDCFFGLRHDSKIARVDEFCFDMHGPVDAIPDIVEVAANRMWHVGQKFDPRDERRTTDSNGKMWPLDVRSLSTGDLLKITDEDGKQTFLAIESIGHREIVEPTNPIVPIEGTWATSRT